ncbi:MAG: preprotein translocase subunit SecG [Clostridiales bacterium]|nr:preprotein translocase subunit SecG [Clostridiales bacterium]
MKLGLIIVHVIIAVVLVVVVLMQHGKQQGLSGAIAGGAETFFGKNKGRTIDAMLKKFTAVVAALFVISSIVLTTVSVKEYKNSANDSSNSTEASESADGQTQVKLDEQGNLVDADGNIVMSAEQVAQQQAASQQAGGDNASADNNANTDNNASADNNATENQTPAE